jgi:putative tryptophan/tyrosine transport system substrate-binding protein
MRRREFIGLVGSSAAAWALPHGAHAQPSAKVVAYFAPSRTQHLVDAFQQGLRDLGHVEGQTIRLDFRFAAESGRTLGEAAAHVVRSRPDVIVVVGVAAASELKRATSVIPIVVAPAGDPVRSGLVSTLAVPDGNITGVSLYGSELNEKRLEVFREAFPDVRRLGALWNANNFAHAEYWADLRTVGAQLGLDLQPLKAHGTAELPDVFGAIRADGLRGLVVVTDAEFDAARDRIVALANEHGVPAIYEHRGFIEVGGLLSYGPNIDRLSYRAATYVDKILKGALPSQLPIEQPAIFELIVNLKAAKALGLTLPPALVARADEVIE